MVVSVDSVLMFGEPCLNLARCTVNPFEKCFIMCYFRRTETHKLYNMHCITEKQNQEREIITLSYIHSTSEITATLTLHTKQQLRSKSTTKIKHLQLGDVTPFTCSFPAETVPKNILGKHKLYISTDMTISHFSKSWV
jgi:hypothetical protein